MLGPYKVALGTSISKKHIYIKSNLRLNRELVALMCNPYYPFG